MTTLMNERMTIGGLDRLLPLNALFEHARANRRRPACLLVSTSLIQPRAGTLMKTNKDARLTRIEGAVEGRGSVQDKSSVQDARSVREPGLCAMLSE